MSLTTSDEALLAAAGVTDDQGDTCGLSPIARTIRVLARASLLLPTQDDAYADEVAAGCREAVFELLKCDELDHDPRRPDALHDHYERTDR